VLDRESAIKKSLQMADLDDIVLIAGKGHEDYQIIGTEKTPFSDLEKAAKYLRENL
jgi:UDP-N-acetylmuramoyl-L-alanyl-D-glutamate--2,6-diaminopimelate ligase